MSTTVMSMPVKLAISTLFAGGFVALAAGAASAMPVAKVGMEAPPITEDVHAVRVCNRWGRCVWSYAGHVHGPRYGWRHPYHRHYGYGRRRYRHW